MRRKKLFNPPFLYDAGGDLAKPWWVEVRYRDPVDNKMHRRRYQEGFAGLKTKKARIQFADELKSNLQAKLLRGWIPPDDDKKNQVVYIDELEYHEAARVYGRKREANKNIRFYASEYITLVKNTKAKKTFESYRSKIRYFIAWLENENLVDNDLKTIDEKIFFNFFDWLINTHNYAGRTVKKYHIQLSTFFRYLVNRKVILIFPVPNIDIPETDEDFSAAPFLDEDIAKILPIIKDEDPQLFLAAMMQYYCFVRPGNELLKMKIKQINITARTIFIPRDIAKKRLERVIDIPRQLAELLVEQGIIHFGKEMYVFGRTGRPGPYMMGYNTLRNRFNIVRDRLGMSLNYKWYSFKHTGAGKLLESGATISELMNQLGHTDITSTYRYIRRHFGEHSERIRDNFPDPIKS